MDVALPVGSSAGMLTVPWFTARETAALIVAVVSLLCFRVFRERCLLVWGAGWVVYGAFLWVAGANEVYGASNAMAALARPAWYWRWDCLRVRRCCRRRHGRR